MVLFFLQKCSKTTLHFLVAEIQNNIELSKYFESKISLSLQGINYHKDD